MIARDSEDRDLALVELLVGEGLSSTSAAHLKGGLQVLRQRHAGDVVAWRAARSELLAGCARGMRAGLLQVAALGVPSNSAIAEAERLIALLELELGVNAADAGRYCVTQLADGSVRVTAQRAEGGDQLVFDLPRRIAAVFEALVPYLNQGDGGPTP